MTDTVERKTFALEEPAVVASGIYTELSLRKPKGRELRLFDAAMATKGTIAGYYDIIADLAEVPVLVIDAAPARDCRRMIKWIDSFFDLSEAG